MTKSDLIIYKDRIQKLHRAVLHFEKAHKELEFQQNKIINGVSIESNDWVKLTKFMSDNPDLSNKLFEIEETLKNIIE